MIASPRRSSRALILCALVLASQTLVATSTTKTKPCEALSRWAQQYADARPTLADLTPFDRGHRLAMFNAITPEARSALWREQLDRFSRDPQLSDAQRALVREGRTLVTPAFYRQDPIAAATMAAFWKRAEGAFSRDQRRVWFTLGATLPSSSARGTSEDWCGCNSGWGWFECESGSCPSGGCEQRLACGLSGGSVCDGICAPLL